MEPAPLPECSIDPSAVVGTVDAAVASWGSDPTRLLQVLREVQERHRCVPPAALERAAQRLHLPGSDPVVISRA
jgi:NADH:ubiquinone oxidoreductase subunit E